MLVYQLLKNGIVVTESTNLLDLINIVDKDISTDASEYEIRTKED